MEKRLFSIIILIICLLVPVFLCGQAWAGLTASVTLYSGDPTAIYPGETTRLQITLGNDNDYSPINNVAFSNLLPGTLPNGLKISGAAVYICTDPSGAPCTPQGTLTADLNTQAISLSGGVIPAHANNTDGTVTIVIPVTASTSTGSPVNYTYTIVEGAVTGDDIIPGPPPTPRAVFNIGDVSQSISVLALTPPTMSKTFGSSTVYLGDNPTTLTVTVTNTTPVAITNFSITDNFPQLGGSAIIRVAPAPGASASCNNGGSAPAFSPSPSAGDTSITATGTIPARSGSTNGSCTLTVNVEGAQTNGSYSTGAQTNTINRQTDFSNDIGIVPTANATANITVTSPLNVTKAFAHTSLSSGESDSLTITLSNRANSDLTITTFTDDPIDGTTAGNTNPYGLKVTGQSTTCAGGSVAATTNNTGVTLTGGTIPADGSCTVTINFTGTVTTPGVPISYTNTIPEGAVGTTTPGIISRTRSASILVADDLRVLKTATPSQAAPGNPVQYAVTVQNYGAAALNNVAVTDHLINGMTFLTGTINGNNYTPSLSGTGCVGLTVTDALGPPGDPAAVGDTTPVFTIGTFPPRTDINNPGSCTVTFYAMTSTGAGNGSSTGNTIGVGDICHEGGTPCNGAGASSTPSTTVTTTVLSANKSFNPAGPLAEGTISTMTITLTSRSANPMTNVSLSDTLPLATVGGGQLRIADPANAASTCGTPTITATPGSTSITMNNGTIPARANNGTGANGTCFIRADVIGPAGTYNNTATIAGTDPAIETYANGSTHMVGPVSSNTATLVYTSSLSGTKSFNPTGVSSGGRSTVTVRLSNSGATALTNVGVTDPLPTGMVVAPTPNAYTTCAGSPVITANPSANSVIMTGATIAGSGTCDLLFDVVATGSANWVNTIPVGYIIADGGVRNQTAVAGTLNYSAPTDLSVAKATNPSTLIFPGQVSRFTITITNGTQAVTNLRLTDYFTTNGTSGAPGNGMVIATTPAASTTCPGGIVSATAGGTSVGLSGASLAASASCTVSVNVTSTAVGGITNYIPTGSIVTDQGLTNGGQATTSLATQSNIGVVKQFTPNVVKPGERSRLRITFYNPTSLPMANLAVTDTLPSGVTVPSGPNSTTTCLGATVSSPASNQVQVSGGTLAAAAGGVAASCYAEIDVLVSAQGDYVNTIPAGGVTASSGGVPTTNSQPTSDTLRARSPLVVHKAIGGYTLDAGNPVGFTTGSATRAPGSAAPLVIRIDNPSAAPLTAAALTDTLPTGLVVATTPNASTTCTGGVVTAPASATNIRLSGATIPASGYCTLTVDVLSNISGSYTNTIAAEGITTFEGISNEEPTSAQLIVSTPPTVSKQFSPAVIPPNGTSTLTIFLNNDNASAVTLTSAFTDTLPTAPGNIVIASTPNVVKTCPGTVTANAGSGTITYANASQIPAGGCTISVDVTGATAGVHTNNIPAGALQTNFGNNQQPANSTLTVSTMGFISGKVFRDNNVTPNGTFESGTDTPISGASIELRSGANCSGPLVNSGLTNPATTDAVGNYLFSGLAAGTYSVCQPGQPAGTVNGITTAGTITSVNGSTGTAGTASNPTTTTSQIVSIVLNGNGAGGEISGSPGNNFAEVVPSSISGVVFLDQNNNGVQNGADLGITNVTIELLNNVGTVVATTTTDANGAYTFTNLLPGTYSVREPTQPPDTANGITTAGTVANGGTAGTVTLPTMVPSLISTIILPPDTATIGNDFAEIPLGRRISGLVFLDYNNDGIFNGSDHGIGSQTLNLTGTDVNGNAVSRSITTNSDGTYDFLSLPEGTYTVDQPSQPAGTTNGITTAGSTGGTASNPTSTSSRIATIDLNGTNAISANNNFAEYPGSAPDLALAKTHTPASLGVSSSTGYFTITPSNVGTISTSGTITLTDTLPTGLTPAGATGTGWTCSIVGQTVTCTTTSVIAAGASGNAITVRITVGAGLSGQVLVNTATISGGGEPVGFDGNNTATDAVPITDTASLRGTVWLDPDHDRTLDSGELRLANWVVELLLNGVTVGSTVTATDGTYAFTDISPGSGYRVRFLASANGTIFAYPVPNESGTAFTNGVVSPSNPAGADTTDGTLNGLILAAGNNYVEQSLPVDPSGVVYDAITRLPVSGATVVLTGPGGFDPAVHLVGGVPSATQVTGPLGYYEFLLLPGAPSGVYTISVTPPAGYLPGTSTIIPPTAGPYVVPGGPAPVAIQAQPTAPTGSQPTTYYLTFSMSGASAAVVNNHIPLDPVMEGALIITKTVNKKTASIGDLILYTLRIQNTTAAILDNITIRDNIPPGFKYVEGSARIDGQRITPVGSRPIEFQGLTFAAHQTRTITYILIVGSGVQEGEYENTAFALRTGSRISNIAKASVCVVKDPIFELMTIIGKVFHDKNENGVQDEGEEGIALAKVVSVRGEIITTDKFGRYHMAGVDAGRPDRGKNFILKVDPKSLPAGARFTTDNPRVIRITPGLMEKINFGVQLPEKDQKSSAAIEPMKEGGGGDVAPAPGGSAIPAGPGMNAAPGGEAPSISVAQDRFFNSPKLNLSMGNDIILRTDKGLKEDIAFFIYTNYPDFIQEYKIIIYAKADLECKYPLKTIELKKANNYEPVYWNGILDNEKVIEANKEYKYLLHAFNKEGRRDETLPKFFTVSSGPLLAEKKEGDEKTGTQKTIPGFGVDNTAQRSIIPKGEKVVMYGKDLAPTDQVYIDEQSVAVDDDGSFVAESIKSPGEHQSTIVVKDAQGAVKASQVEKVAVAGEEKGSFKAFFKDFFQDFFIVGIVDLTLGQYSFRGHVEPIAQDDHYDEKVYVDGRAAFYLKGKIKGEYLLTAYLDTEEGKIQDIIKRLGDKDPKRIFRNLDPDKYYPVYGDDSTLVSDVETQGRFYVRIEWDKSKVLWGNYNTQITGTELARYNRSLYGAKVYYESLSQTKFGDSKTIVTGFVAEAQSLQDHNEFLSTGGSLYYLRYQNVVEGSEKVSIQIRDKDSGRVKNTATLAAGADYTIDYYQGRILLNSPLPILADSYTIISSALANGDVVSLVVDYEYNSECFGCNNGVENLTGGVRGFWWIFDQLGVGSTFVREARDDKDYNLYGVDAKVKLFKGTYANVEFASSQQTQIPGSFSVDGGLNFSSIKTSTDKNKGNAYKIGQVIDFKEITNGAFPLDLEAYYIFREEGFSSLDKDTEHDTTEFGVKLQYEVAKNGTFRLRHSTFDEKDALYESTSTAQLEWRWTDRLRSLFEVRYKKLKESEGYVQPVHPEDDHVLDNEEDVIGGVKVAYDLNKGTQLYAAQQITLYRNDETPRDNKTTLGISTQITKWLRTDLEGFVGDLGYGGRVGLTTSINDKLNTYTSYMLSTDRTEGRTQKVTVGSTYRINDKTDIYSENQFKDSMVETANSDILGFRYRPTKRWNFDLKYENSHVTKDSVDSYVEQNIIKRDTASLGVTYDHEPLKASTRFELRLDRGDEDENQYVTTTSIKYTVDKEWTFLGNFNFSLTRNQTNNTDDARFFEISTGFAYRPIKLDKLNMLFKYTYLEDLPPLSQEGSTDVDERSHVVSLEGIYDLSRYFSLGGKAAYKVAQMRLGRTSGEWFSSDTMLFVGRLNYQFIKNWDASLEYRFLKVVQAKDYKHGPVVSLYRHIGDHVMVGAGYNFTDYNDDLTNLNYKAGGWFFNLIASW